MENPRKTLLLVLAALTALLGVYLIYSGTTANSDKKMFNKYVDTAEYADNEQFMRDVYNKQVDTVYYNTNNEYMVYTLLNEETAVMTREQRDEYVYTDEYYRRTLYTAGESFRQQMIQSGVNLVLVRDGVTGTMLMQLVISLFPCLLIIVFLMSTMKMQGLGGLTEEQLIQTSSVGLDDIIGLDELKDEIQLIIKLLKDDKYGERLGVKLPNGILLSGAPGVGKTMIAKAIAKEAGVTFISVAASDFQELFVGNGARHIREVFRIARKHIPCIVFIDEIDAIGVARGRRGSTGEDNQTINALLKEMDGFKEREGIFVLAATNHPENLDEAIKRAGRFDREIVIPAPRNWEIRKQLFEHYLKDKPVSDDADLETLSRQTAGFTGADIAMVCNEAGIVALADDLDIITHECIEEAIDKRVFKGSRSKVKTYDKDKYVVARHEAGHALMSRLCGEPIARASIMATTSGVGGAVFHEDSNEQLKTRRYYRNRIMICYAGRAAEQISFNDITTGASNDITQATEIMTEYIGKLGFEESYGLIDLSVMQNSANVLTDVLEDKITTLSKNMYANTVYILGKHSDALEKLAGRLMEVGSMTGKQIEQFLSECGVSPLPDTESGIMIDESNQ